MFTLTFSIRLRMSVHQKQPREENYLNELNEAFNRLKYKRTDIKFIEFFYENFVRNYRKISTNIEALNFP